MEKPRICVDFDGTITPDGRIIFPDCISTLTRLHEKYRIAIYSARLTEAERLDMEAVLDSNKVPYDEILPRKPEADYYIDDKAIRFEGWDKISL